MLEQTKELYNIARESDDIGAMEFISEIISEQIKKIGCFKKISYRIKSSNIISTNIDILDNKINNFSF